MIKMDLVQQTVNDLKVSLLNKLVKESDLDKYLLAKGLGQLFVDTVKAAMINTPGFSFMNGNVTYRGADYVAPLPPNQPH